jgi:hypothetical protein
MFSWNQKHLDDSAADYLIKTYDSGLKPCDECWSCKDLVSTSKDQPYDRYDEGEGSLADDFNPEHTTEIKEISSSLTNPFWAENCCNRGIHAGTNLDLYQNSDRISMLDFDGFSYLKMEMIVTKGRTGMLL